MLLVGCASAPTQAPEAAPATVSLQEYVQQAAKAAAEGSREKARDTYRIAARAYPASQLPWLKLAEDYFEAADYGNAILAAQEVLQRDASDSTASSLLAVSGLRVSTSALQLLKSQKNLSAGTRNEAESMARSLREVLGETVLVAQPASSTGSGTSQPSAGSKSQPKTRSAVATRSQTASAARPQDTSRSPSSNPFDKLK